MMFCFLIKRTLSAYERINGEKKEILSEMTKRRPYRKGCLLKSHTNPRNN